MRHLSRLQRLLRPARHGTAAVTKAARPDADKAELAESALRLRRLADAVEQVACARDIQTLFDVIRHSVRELTGADGVTLVLRENGHCHYVDEDAISPLWKGQRFPVGACISGWVMLHAETAVIPDIYEDPRIPVDAYRPTFVRSLSMVPVRRPDPIGAIGCYWASPHTATPGEIELQQALANALSVGLSNLDLYRRLETARAEAEQAADESRGVADELRVAQRLAGIGSWLWDVRSDRHVWSDEVFRIYGRPRELDPARYPEVREYYTPASWDVLAAAVERALATGESYECDAEVVQPGGERRWVTVRGEAVRGPDGAVSELHGSVQDITQRKRSEQRILQLNRRLRTITEITALMVKEGDRERLLDETCRILVEHGQFLLAWIGFAREDGCVIPAHAAGAAMDYARGLDVRWDDTPTGQGPAGSAIREGRRVLEPDLTASATFSPWRGRALEAGIRCSAAFPLRIEGQPVGAISVYDATPYAIGDDDVELLEALANDLSYALASLQSNEERVRAERARRKSDERYRIVADNTYAWEFWEGPEGGFVYCSPSCARVTGYPAAQFLADPGLRDRIVHPEDRELFRAHRRERHGAGASGGDVGAAEISFRIVRPDGAVRWVSHVCAPLASGDGQYLGTRGSNRDVTASREAAEELSKLSRAIEQSPVSIVITDLGGDIEYVNPYFTKLTGYAFDEVRGKNPRMLKSDQTPASTHDDLWRTLTAGSVWQGELVNRKKDGDLFVEEAVIAPVVGADGRVTHYVAIKEDVTERKRTLEDLRREKERLDSASRSGKVVMWEWTLATDRIETAGFADPRAVLRTGETTTLNELMENVHPDDREVFLGALAAHLESSAPFETEFRMRRLDETWAWWKASGAAARDEDGRPLRVSGASIDISELKEAERALEDASARLSEAQELAGLGTWSLELATDALAWSPKMYQIFEKDPATFAPTRERVLEATHPEDRDVVLKAFTDSIGSHEPREIDSRLLLPDGRVRWMKLGWRTEFDRQGLPRRAVGTALDITEHMLALEARELAKAKEAAEEASRAKSSFLASMSHEIRTPMNAILGFTQLLLGDPDLGPAHREQVGTILRSGEHLLSLINDILEISKIEAGRVSVTLAETDLQRLLADLESMFTQRARAKGVSLDVIRPPDLPSHVLTDEKRLRQILINLLGNAMKFTSAGGVTVRVRTEPRQEGGLLLGIDVTDTGPGIPEADLARLFQKFEQTEAGRATGGGTGLGLALSRGFARLMGGDISVRSTVGAGSTFSLTLPVSETASPATGARTAQRRIAGLPPGEDRKRILVAEDVAENREIFRRMLERVGFEVRTASNGAAAVELFRDWPPNLVIMDLRMPGLDGLEATRSIRAAETGKRVPILAVTASAFEENRAEAMAAGADGFLRKPFREAELLQRVGEAIGVSYVEEDVAPAPDAAETSSESALEPIPEESRAALLAAVEEADFDAVRFLVEGLRARNPDAAARILALADSYQNERLLALLRPSEA